MSVRVLEARSKVGGRVNSAMLGGSLRVDTGGQFLCEDMPELMALAARYGKSLVPTFMAGRRLVRPPVSDREAERIWSGSAGLRAQMDDLDLAAPELAGLSVADWLAAQPADPAVKTSFRALVEGLWCMAPEKIPLWYLADNDRRITNETSELQYFLGETMHSLAEDLAAGLGDAVRLGVRATAVHHGGDGVEVIAGTESFRGRTAILALPPAQAARLVFLPALNRELAAALGAWQSGTVIKAMVAYRRAFWRERGLSGMVSWRDPLGLFFCDGSRDAAQPVLIVFIGGSLALRWGGLGKAGLRAEVLAHLVTAFGAEAGEIADIHAAAWLPGRGENGGGYSDLIVDGRARDAEARLIAGSPPLVFAASELSPSFPGYIEGAVVAGRAAAERALRSL